MKSYPKSPSEIGIRCSREGTAAAATGLQAKLTEYVTHFGRAHGCFMTIFMELFRHGKVIVEFGGYSERLELESSSDALNYAQAANLLYDFSETMDPILQARKKRSTLRIPVPQKVGFEAQWNR